MFASWALVELLECITEINPRSLSRELLVEEMEREKCEDGDA
jgi:hypothetical protein